MKASTVLAVGGALWLTIILVGANVDRFRTPTPEEDARELAKMQRVTRCATFLWQSRQGLVTEELGYESLSSIVQWCRTHDDERH